MPVLHRWRWDTFRNRHCEKLERPERVLSMQMRILDVTVFQEVVGALIQEAAHDGSALVEVLEALAVCIAIHRVPGTEIEFARTGSLSTLTWVHVGGGRYAFAFDHASGDCIQVRRDGTQGLVVATFNNNSTLHQVRQFFIGTCATLVDRRSSGFAPPRFRCLN